MSSQTLFYALLGGILPALLWLWFWLKEDKARPEPRGVILRTFLAGMAAVPLVVPFEKIGSAYLGGGPATIVLWAAIEEVFKYGAATFAALRSRFMDEPIDGVIYLITAALGFSALENALFLSGPLGNGEFLRGFITGDLRFVGATLLHTVSSAAIGGSIALSFYKHRRIKLEYHVAGVVLAILLHAIFNFLILQRTDGNFFFVFGFVWTVVLALILFFERIKRMKTE